MKKRPKKLLNQVRDAIRLKHYSMQTEEAYVNWIRRYILFHNERHLKDMGSRKILGLSSKAYRNRGFSHTSRCDANISYEPAKGFLKGR